MYGHPDRATSGKYPTVGEFGPINSASSATSALSAFAGTQRSAVGRRQQLLAIDDRHHAVVAYAPRRVDPVADDVVRDRAARASGLRRLSGCSWAEIATVQRGRYRAGCARLPARQSERADVDRRRVGVLPVVDQHRLGLQPQRPVFLLPGMYVMPVLHSHHCLWVERMPVSSDASTGANVRDVPYLISGRGAGLNVAHQIDLARRSPGSCDPRHIRAICA